MEILRSAASLCCACADHIEWFLLGRLLQGLGESIEPVIFAMARDAGPSGDAVGGWVPPAWGSHGTIGGWRDLFTLGDFTVFCGVWWK